jgi:hypothetical protein
VPLQGIERIKTLIPFPIQSKMKKKSFLKKLNPPSPPLCTCPMKEKKKP